MMDGRKARFRSLFSNAVKLNLAAGSSTTPLQICVKDTGIAPAMFETVFYP